MLLRRLRECDSLRTFQIDWPNFQIIIPLLIGVLVLTTADAADLAGLMGTPPIAIEVRAEPIAAFTFPPAWRKSGRSLRPALR